MEAIILKGAYDQAEATEYDLRSEDLGFDLTLFFVSNEFLDYWQKKLNISGNLETNNRFPNKRVIYELMRQISSSKPIEYAVVTTAYVGGMGEQFANVYKDLENVDPTLNTINLVLKYLGVVPEGDFDEFDTVGLGKFRRNPDYLDKYG